MAIRKLKKPLVWVYPKGIEDSYRRELLRLVKEWQDLAQRIIIARIPRLVDNANAFKNPIATNIISADSQDTKNDDWVDDLSIVMDEYIVATLLLLPPMRPKIQRVGSDVSVFNNRQWHKIVKHSLDIDHFNLEPWLQTHLKSFNEQNETLIRKMLDNNTADIKGMIERGINEGKKASVISSEILKGTDIQAGVFKKTRNTAAFIGWDQVSKLNGQLEMIRQTDIGVSTYQWQTRRDERVRASHAAMDSRECVWHNSEVYVGHDDKLHPRSGINGVRKHPGEDFQCRCTSIPNFDSIPNFESRFL